ncbi:hypothetical protein NDU88_008893 [Pleurodeles waltl]|uniref:Uncharacterized protein n=1 Tax=Pleurodeles waltl TaxID=8319 RepID=A0AAV7QU46_PLEWA|nr:hypothetical protein NDU88_008893 [Pleurodeles waltl]
MASSLPRNSRYIFSCKLAPVMPSGKSSAKSSYQLLLSEVIAQHCPMASPQTLPALEPYPALPCPTPDSTMEHILWDVTAGRPLTEGMVNKISDLAAENKFICISVAGF